MGCMFSHEVAERKDHDLVGIVSGRSKRDLDLANVPKERLSMVNVELLAESKTIYRAKHLKFGRVNSIDYDDDKHFHALRKILDEPVGRFYLREFLVAKEIKDAKEKMDLWVDIFLLTTEDPSELVTVSTQTEMKADTDEDIVTKDSYIQNNPKEKVEALVKRFLEDDSEEKVNFDDEVKAKEWEEKVNEIKSSLNEKSINTLEEAQQFLQPLANFVFRDLGSGELVTRFKAHSEYKRYKMKIMKVYNAISHRDFDFMNTLGKGSFGRVLAVRKRTTKKVYALKVMSKKKILSGAESAAQVTIERNVLVTCAACPFIVTPYFAFQTTRALFLALELLSGGNLIEAMSHSGGTLSIEVVQFHSAQIILGLDYMHRHGIIFRDLKPLNVMLDRKGNAVLTDMGLCAKISPSQFPKSQDGVNSTGQRLKQRKSMEIMKPEKLKCVGTYGFRAPEVMDVSETKTGYGPAVDYWALGVTIYYLLESKFPFKEKMGKNNLFAATVDQKVMERKMHQQRRDNPEYFTPELCSLLDGFLEKDPEKRLGSSLEETQAHPFYSSIDWKKLERCELKSPFKPRVRDVAEDAEPMFTGLAEAMSNFSADNVLEMFGGENDMQDEYRHVKRKDQRLFKEWDFFPDDALALDWEIAEQNTLERRNTLVSAT